MQWPMNGRDHGQRGGALQRSSGAEIFDALLHSCRDCLQHLFIHPYIVSYLVSISVFSDLILLEARIIVPENLQLH